MSTRFVIEQIKQAVNPELLLSVLGFSIYKSSSRELRCPCKIHGSSNPTSFSFKLDTGTFKCFSRGCGDGKSRDVIGLVMLVNGVTFSEALRFLSDMTGISLDNKGALSNIDYEKYERDKFIRNSKRLNRYKELLPEISDQVVDNYILNRSDYYVNRGYNSMLLDFFEVGEAVDDKGVVRATIPIRDEFSRLVSVDGRKINFMDEANVPKFKQVTNFKKASVLYNLNNVVINLHSTTVDKTVIITEGYGDVWSLVDKGFANTVAVMGADLSLEQARLIFKYFLDAIILFDGDIAGKKGAREAYKLLKNGIKARIADMPNGKDPADLSSEELSGILLNGGVVVG